MTQAELDQQIAARTGESLQTIQRWGFGPLWSVPYEPDREPLVMDWDEADARREVLFPV